MWFAGLLIGGLVGSVNGIGAAVFGAIVGAIAGAIIGGRLKPSERHQQNAVNADDLAFKIEHIYKSLADIHRRLVRLEEPEGQRAARHDESIAASVAVQTATDNAGRYAAATGAPAAPAAAVPRDVIVIPEQAPIVQTAAHETQPSAPSMAPATPAPQSTAFDVLAPQATPFAEKADASSAPFVTTGPSWWQRLLSGNIVAKVGAVVLFFGTCFLLKFAYDHTFVPVPLRLAGVAIIGGAMVFGGWRLLGRRRLYGLILQGAGIGVLYIDAFFALRVFSLIHPTAGFAIFMALGVAATMLAVRQDAKVLAVLGLVGAFLAPVLAGSREGNHVLLFSYYTLLNTFILAISWFKAWRDLNLVGFIFTFIVGVFWGAHNYRPEMFPTVEPFVLIFFAMYLVIPILFATRQPPELKGLVDGTLVFGTPLSTAFMQAGLVRDMPYGLAWSAGLAAALYALLAISVWRRERMRLLGETYAALATVFGTMAIFFALDAYPTFALWTLEGAAIVWVGLRQRRLLAREFGLALQFGGAWLFLFHYSEYSRTNPWLNDFVLGCALIAAAGAISAWLMHKHRDALTEGGQRAGAMILVWACGWWFAGGLRALHDGLPPGDFNAAALIFAAVTFALAETLGGWLEWATLRRLTFLHLPAMFLGLLAMGGRHPLAGLGAVAWPLNFTVYFWCLHWQQQDGLATVRGLRYRLGWVLLAVLATWEGLWLIDHNYHQWSLLLGATGILVGWVRYNLRERADSSAGQLSVWALLWGAAFWLGSGLDFIEERMPAGRHIAFGLGFTIASCALFEILGGWARWQALRRMQLIILPAMALAALMQLERGSHPAANDAWLAWLAAFAAFYAIIYRQQKHGIALGANNQHVFAVWIASGLAAWELAWQSAQLNSYTSWAFAMWGAVPALTLLLVAHYGRRLWPWRDDFAFFRNVCLGPLALYCVLWSLISSWDPSRTGTFAYFPLLNPIDLAQVTILCGLRVWVRASAAPAAEGESAYPAMLGALAFVWLNSVVLRTIHHWFDIPYVAHQLFNSIVVQAAFSLLWTLTAMALMVYATRKRDRRPWFVGAALLAVVVGKLFLLDLANSGTVARIVSFLGVGVLLMVIGYVAPVPPGDAEKQHG